MIRTAEKPQAATNKFTLAKNTREQGPLFLKAIDVLWHKRPLALKLLRQHN